MLFQVSWNVARLLTAPLQYLGVSLTGKNVRNAQVHWVMAKLRIPAPSRKNLTLSKLKESTRGSPCHRIVVCAQDDRMVFNWVYLHNVAKPIVSLGGSGGLNVWVGWQMGGARAPRVRLGGKVVQARSAPPHPPPPPPCSSPFHSRHPLVPEYQA